MRYIDYSRRGRTYTTRTTEAKMQEVWPVFVTQAGDDGTSDELKAVCSNKETAKAWLMGASMWYVEEMFGEGSTTSVSGHSFQVKEEGKHSSLELRHLDDSGNYFISTLLAYSYSTMVIRGPDHADSDGRRLANL